MPNLGALKSKLEAGLPSDLVEALGEVTTMGEVTDVLSARLHARVATLEEEMDATPEVA